MFPWKFPIVCWMNFCTGARMYALHCPPPSRPGHRATNFCGKLMQRPMKLNNRQQELLNHLQKKTSTTTAALAARFEVTPQPIRRDVLLMEDHQRLSRYHGGVRLPGGLENLAHSTRQTLLSAEKQAIAAQAAQHIPNRSTIFINMGTTAEAVASALRQHRGLRVITNSLHVAAVMCDFPQAEVIIAGGVVRPRDRGITGEAAIDLIQKFKVDFAVIGISSIDLDGTLRDYDHREIRVTQAVMAQSHQVLLVADRSKIGRPALVRLGHISEIDALFTDAPLPASMNGLFAAGKPAVHIANFAATTPTTPPVSARRAGKER